MTNECGDCGAPMKLLWNTFECSAECFKVAMDVGCCSAGIHSRVAHQKGDGVPLEGASERRHWCSVPWQCCYFANNTYVAIPIGEGAMDRPVGFKFIAARQLHGNIYKDVAYIYNDSGGDVIMYCCIVELPSAADEFEVCFVDRRGDV